MMDKLSSILMQKMLSEEGENALHVANVIRRYGVDGWNQKKMERALKMINPNLKELSLFFDVIPSDVEKISKEKGISLSNLTFVCMVLKPTSFFVMNEETLSLSRKLGIQSNGYDEFLKEWRKLLHSHREYVDDFLDLYLLLFGKNDKKMSDNSIVLELSNIFKNKDFLSLTQRDVEDFQEIYSSLLPSDREKVVREISDPYVKGVLLRRVNRALIVDGSNIAMVNRTKADLDNIFYVFKAIGNVKKVPWPFFIVFDANFPYQLKASQRVLFEKELQRHPHIYLHSPADEKILEMASYMPSYVLTNDRYLDYPKVDFLRLRFDGKKVWEDRR